MSATLNLGTDGNWATKKDTILAYNDENSNFKPLAFNFDRDTLATRVNKEGLIETVGSGEPRIDYKDDSKGALLLEPSRTNLTLYSEDLSNSYWAKQNGSITSNVIASPSGVQNADLFTENTSNGDHAVFDIVNYFVSGTTYTLSFFAKANGRTKVEVASANSGTCPTARFDLEAKTATATNTSFGAKIEDYGNGWFRCSVSRVAPNSGLDLPYYATVINFGILGHQGDGTSGMYFWGMQTEAGSYATSYIPTQGGVVTRVADVCNNGANEQVINSTEGVLYLEGSALAGDGTDRKITLSDNSQNNAIIFGYSRFSGNINAEVKSGGVLQTSGFGATGVTQENNNKFALSWGGGISKFYVNGTLASSYTNVTSPIGMNVLNFSLSSGFQKMFLNTKDLRVYNTALTDQELINLTTI